MAKGRPVYSQYLRNDVFVKVVHRTTVIANHNEVFVSVDGNDLSNFTNVLVKGRGGREGRGEGGGEEGGRRGRVGGGREGERLMEVGTEVVESMSDLCHSIDPTTMVLLGCFEKVRVQLDHNSIPGRQSLRAVGAILTC